jgi:hypothetical protein
LPFQRSPPNREGWIINELPLKIYFGWLEEFLMSLAMSVSPFGAPRKRYRRFGCV